MWDELLAGLAEFESAVLTGTDADGYPYSLRCHPQPDASAPVLRLALPAGTPLRPGPAGLLCHRHDEWLWHQQSFLVRGLLVSDHAGWGFRPLQFIPGLGFGGALGQVRFVLGARRAARDYLAKRGLPRPRVPWDEILAIKRQANLTPHLTRSPSLPRKGEERRMVIGRAGLAGAAVVLVAVGALALGIVWRGRQERRG